MAMDCYLYLGSKPPIKHEMDYNNCVTWKSKKCNMIKRKKNTINNEHWKFTFL
jgi:hypothetical protein